MKKFQNKYRIQSSRMPGWDYARGGKYYVTIITRNRICCFGDVVNNEMRLNEMGKIVDDLWLQIPNHFENTFLDEHVVMPNHIHGIVVMKRSHLKNNRIGLINGNDNDCVLGNDAMGNVETRHASSLHPIPNGHPVPTVMSPSNHININDIGNGNSTVSELHKKNIPESPKPGSLPVIIGSFKSACTKKFNESGFQWVGWQSRFYDEVIRNDNRLQQIRTYIRNNPNNWNNDEHFN